MPYRHRSRTTRTFRHLIVVLSALASIAGLSVATAVANPGPLAAPHATPVDPSLHHRIKQVNAKLDRLARQNDQLDEQYNVAATAVTAARHKATRAQHAADQARARYRAAHAAFVRTVTQQYENAYSPSAGELLTSGSTQEYLDGLALSDYLSSRFAATVDAQKTARADAADATHRAATTLAAARAKEAALATRRAALQRHSHQFRQLLGTLTARQQAERAAAEAVAAAKAQAALAAERTVTANAPTAGTHHGGGGHHAPAPPAPSAGPVSAQIQKVIAFAEAQVGKCYSYAGSGPSCYDCSGLTMMSYAQIGIHLPHSAAGQYSYGTHVAYSDLQPGDLIFLYSPIGHVEIYVGNDLAVSAANESTGIVYVHPSQDMGSYVGATRLVS